MTLAPNATESDMATILGQGVYTYSEAARLTALRTSRIREWFRGRPSEASREPVFQGDYAPIDGDFAISFHDLIDVYVAGQLREHGVSMQTLRRVYGRMRKDLGSPHPFCRKELLSDGKLVFIRNAGKGGADELTEVLTGQGVFPSIILPFLKTIDYDRLTILASRWRVADHVVIDPTICLGKPVVEAAGIPTAILATAFLANRKDSELVADWYGISAQHVLAAADFERRLAA